MSLTTEEIASFKQAAEKVLALATKAARVDACEHSVENYQREHLMCREKLAAALGAEPGVSLAGLVNRAVERITSDAQHEARNVAAWEQIQTALPEPAPDDSRSLLERALQAINSATRPIDRDLDDMPRIGNWSRDVLERAFREAARACGEEKTENRRLRKLLGIDQQKTAAIDSSAPSKCLGLRWVPLVGNVATLFIDDHFVIQTLDVGAKKPSLLVLAEVRQPDQSEETFFKPVKRAESESIEIR